MKLCKSLFFDDGQSFYGKESSMSMSLGNFKNEIIHVTLIVNGKEVPLNLSNYIEAHKTRDVRIYLLTKTIDETSSEEESESEGPGGSLRSMLYSLQPGNEETDQSLVTMEVDADNGVVPFASPFFKRDGGADSGSLSAESSVKSEPLHRKEEEADNGFVSGLIGTSGQRERLRMQQLEQYHASLNEDRIKEQKKEEEKVKLRRKKKCMVRDRPDFLQSPMKISSPSK
ncbi:uncharacterized protein LOC116614558 [Nematostella vectensis]|uniref:uncharacterized protein LOC116614558 n=1 Tax=Nematostella vectensis TaxID=45351 RepID=UPI002077153C|nr:uncharacterized protein LOC116614558 [Nematostella vectensis]XP_048576980.1 uncharacterized protein LOC116614558 [Nematostella vectensis]